MQENDIAEIIQIPRIFLDGLGVGISIVDCETGFIRFANAEFCRSSAIPWSNSELPASAFSN